MKVAPGITWDKVTREASGQGVTTNCIYGRLKRGWTWDETCNGRKVNPVRGTGKHLRIQAMAKIHRVSVSCIYNRLNHGWTWDEIVIGHKERGNTWEREAVARYDLSSGMVSFMVLLFDVIKSITKLCDIDNYPLTVGIFYSLLDKEGI
jgi:hypothetical protein